MHRHRESWLVVTDLDGSLLDDGYDLPAAARAIDRQAGLGRTVALASSKTLEEMQCLARLCQIPPVLIFENGGGIAWPDGQCRDPARYRVDSPPDAYPVLRRRLRRLRRGQGYQFLGFADLSPREVARLTGLSEAAARLARHRRLSEPVLWLDEPARLDAFADDVAASGYRLVAGGRFHHVMPRTDKAQAMRRVAGDLVSRTRRRVCVVACGDADNDLAMLQGADRALVFPRRGGGYLEVRDAVGMDVGIRVPQAGPAPWSRALDRLACAARPNGAPGTVS